MFWYKLFRISCPRKCLLPWNRFILELVIHLFKKCYWAPSIHIYILDQMLSHMLGISVDPFYKTSWHHSEFWFVSPIDKHNFHNSYWRLEGPRPWKYIILFHCFLFCFVLLYLNKLYKVCKLNRRHFLKQTNKQTNKKTLKQMALLSRSSHSARQCFSKCDPWTSSISITWEWLGMEILRHRLELLNLKLFAGGWGPVICLFVNLPGDCESLRNTAKYR